MLRTFPRPIKRVVIKVGSSVIATYKMKPRIAHLQSLVKQICDVQRQGIEVVLVSSGAIVLGMGELKQNMRPSNLAGLQARAALGQSVLMSKYMGLFKRNKGACAQMLLTWDDFDNRDRYNNARNTIAALLDLNIVPIINENDSISTDEIRFGDNDKLSALVAGLIHADLLLILSDVEGLYQTKDGTNHIFDEIQDITKDIEQIAGGTSKKQMSKGGMIAKLEAVKIVTHANIPCIIAHGEMDQVLPRVLKGERIGTFFVEKAEKLLARKHWISFGAKPKGVLVIDDGAVKAILQGGRSLLLPGIASFEGHFKSGDVVVIHDKKGQEIARGITRYSVMELQKIDNKKGKNEVIHRNDLVLSKR